MRDPELLSLVADVEAVDEEKRASRLTRYTPYLKQKQFHEAGADFRERCFFAGNQLGKTLAGSHEMAYHLTGRYPKWWKGRRFEEPIRAWAAGQTNLSTRDTVQYHLMGGIGEWGTGTIPKKDIEGAPAMGRGLANAVDTVHVRHYDSHGVFNGLSTLTFKSYEQGFLKWAGPTLHVVWMDEEPPSEIYSEALARITATNGMVYLTHTPLLGMSEVVAMFLQPEDLNAERWHITMTIYDVGHLTPEGIKKAIAGYKPHERRARAEGLPMLGSGAIFPVAEEALYDSDEPIPPYFARIAGIDFGFGHPTAGAWLAYDRDTDVVHLYDVYRSMEELPAIHATSFHFHGDWIPIAWPHDGLMSEKGTGISMAQQYLNLGCNFLDEKATDENGQNYVEPVVIDMLSRMRTGRFKVARHLEPFWEEFRLYHRKNGKIVAKKDDVIAAVRYALMMLRHATTKVETEPVYRLEGMQPRIGMIV